MEIWITEDATPPRNVYLCKDTDFAVGVGPADLAITGQRIAQDAIRFRATNRKVFTRKNRGRQVTFTVFREHASEAAAAAFMLDHDGDVPEQGDVHFREDLNGNSIERVMPDAVIESVNGRMVGIGTYHTYSIRGGALTIPST